MGLDQSNTRSHRRDPVLLPFSVDLVDHPQEALRHYRKAELFGNLAGDGSCCGLKPVDLAAQAIGVKRLVRLFAFRSAE
jgi:hypothetical protein